MAEELVEARPVGRRLPIGVEVVAGGVHARVWAPEHEHVELVVEDGPIVRLTPEPSGHLAGFVAGVGHGALYGFRVDGEGPFPDPASRYQPRGVHGLSMVVDPNGFAWTDGAFRGVALEDAVIYELHVGTFTAEGTWHSATRELRRLAELGVTVLELMPVADFPGAFGWGYDGVALFAPSRLYGDPDDMRRFIDDAHRLGLSVILDVVYNHWGPDGSYLSRYAGAYLSSRHTTDWGASFNFDDAGREGARELVLANVRYWIEELHLDGLRLDATQDVRDDSPTHILTEVARVARDAGGTRRTLIVGENEPGDAKLVRSPRAGGHGLDALANDDFHHSVTVAATGRREAYYHDYRGAPQELVSMAKHGPLYQGQRYAWQRKRRGASARGVEPRHFISYLQSHDQIANSLRGERLSALTAPGRLRALTAYLLLGPWTPMLFQGQELGARAPFLYFADHRGALADAVRGGRATFMAQFASLASPAIQQLFDEPSARATFEACKLRPADRDPRVIALHHDLLALRRNDPVFTRGGAALDGAVLGPAAFVLRWFGGPHEDRLLIVNLGVDQYGESSPEPLLAPHAERGWREVWTSEAPRYGGGGAAARDDDDQDWWLPGHCATVLTLQPTEARVS